MRVTNSMLVSNFLNNLNNNLSNVSKLQSQLTSGRKYANISDDPLSTMYGLQARFRLDRLNQFQESVKMAGTWLTQAESSVMDLNEVYKSVYETVINASTDAKNEDDRNDMAVFVKQMRDHVLQTLNSTFGDKYVFAGYNTTGAYPANALEPPYTVDADTGHLWLNGLDLTYFVPNYDSSYDGTLNPGDAGYDAAKNKAYQTVATRADQVGRAAVRAAGLTYDPDYDTTLPNTDPDYSENKANAAVIYQNAYDDFVATYDIPPADYADMQALYDKLQGETLYFRVGTGLTMEVEINAVTLTGSGPENLYAMLDNLYNDLMSGVSVEEIQDTYITKLQNKQSGLLSATAELGGRANRLDLLNSRYEQDFINYTQIKSDAEDADYAELIMYFQMAMNVYNAALATGSSIIQKSLVDFLR